MKTTKGVPIPAPVKPPRQRKYPLDTMEVNDFFFVPGALSVSLSPHVSRQGRLLDRKFTLRTTQAVQAKDKSWKIAAPDNPKAVEGVAVWRVA